MSVSIPGLLLILFTAFSVLLITDSTLNTIKVHDSSYPRVDVFHRNHNVPISFHCPSQAPRVTSLEGDTFLYKISEDRVFSNMSKGDTCTLYLLILVGCNRSEDSLREAEDLEDAPADTEEVICLHNVEARLVTVHGVEDDLAQRQTKEKVSTCNHCQHTVQSFLWRLSGHPFQTRDACLRLVSPPCLYSDSTD